MDVPDEPFPNKNTREEMLQMMAAMDALPGMTLDQMGPHIREQVDRYREPSAQ